MSSKEVIKHAKVIAGVKGSGGSGKPPPQKRAISEVSPNSSVEEISILNHNLDDLAEDVQTIRDDLKQVMKQDDMKEFIQKTISETINELNRDIEVTIAIQVEDATKSLQDRIKRLNEENSDLRKELETVRESLSVCDNRSKVALAQANYNEQYSRKNNIKIMGITEEQGENEVKLVERVTKVLGREGVKVDRSRVTAIHRIPGKKGHPDPVLLKFINNNEKAKIMVHRRKMKESGNRLVDDVTKQNVELMKRIGASPQIESTWYFNGHVYGKTKAGFRHRFDIFDNVSEIVGGPKDSGEREN